MTEVKELITDKIGICFLSDTKLNQSFSHQQFPVDGYNIFRRYRTIYGGEMLFYVNENVQSNVLHLNSTLDDN